MNYFRVFNNARDLYSQLYIYYSITQVKKIVLGVRFNSDFNLFQLQEFSLCISLTHLYWKTFSLFLAETKEKSRSILERLRDFLNITDNGMCI